MEFKISSDFDYECVPESLLCTYDFNTDDVLAYLDENKRDIEKLTEHVYLVFIRDDVAFTFTVNDNEEIVTMNELTGSPKSHCFSDGLLLIVDDAYCSYYNRATLYRVTSDDVVQLMSIDGE